MLFQRYLNKHLCRCCIYSIAVLVIECNFCMGRAHIHFFQEPAELYEARNNFSINLVKWCKCVSNVFEEKYIQNKNNCKTVTFLFEAYRASNISVIWQVGRNQRWQGIFFSSETQGLDKNIQEFFAVYVSFINFAITLKPFCKEIFKIQCSIQCSIHHLYRVWQ